MRNNESLINTLVGVVIVIAIVGIGYLLLVSGIQTEVQQYPKTEHRIDTIKTLPVIEFKKDTVEEPTI